MPACPYVSTYVLVWHPAPMADEHYEWLTRQQAADRLKITPRTLSRWVESGRCPVHRTPGGRPRFRSDEVDALLTSDPPRTGAAPAML